MKIKKQKFQLRKVNVVKFVKVNQIVGGDSGRETTIKDKKFTDRCYSYDPANCY